MRSNYQAQLDVLRGCQAYFNKHRHLWPATATCAAADKLDHAITVFIVRHNNYHLEVMKARHATDRRRELRAQIRDAMRPVVTIGRTVLHHVPELATLRLPNTGASGGTLVAFLYHLADSVTRHRKLFEAEGLESGTADRLRSLAYRMNVALSQREINRHLRRRTRREIAVAGRHRREAEKVLAALMAAERWATPRLTVLH